VKGYALLALSLLLCGVHADGQTLQALPNDGAAFGAYCGDAAHFAPCEQAVLDVNGPKYIRKASGYPDCAITVQDKASIDHAVKRVLSWMASHPPAEPVARDTAIVNALNRSLALC
jgi:hypothetical protein